MNLSGCPLLARGQRFARGTLRSRTPEALPSAPEPRLTSLWSWARPTGDANRPDLSRGIRQPVGPTVGRDRVACPWAYRPCRSLATRATVVPRATTREGVAHEQRRVGTRRAPRAGKPRFVVRAAVGSLRPWSSRWKK